MVRSVRRARTAFSIGLLFVAPLLGGCGQTKNRTPPAATAPAPANPGLAGFPDTPAGHAAVAAARAARQVGPGADTAYQAALQQLRGQGAAAVEALVAGYRSASPTDYGTRALDVEILAELQRPEALPALIEIASTPVPKPAVSGRDDLLNPSVEESIIRMSAVQGVGTFAASDRKAMDTLVTLLGSDASPVREEAGRQLWAASARMEPAQREAIRARIPAELRIDPEQKLGPVSPPSSGRKP